MVFHVNVEQTAAGQDTGPKVYYVYLQRRPPGVPSSHGGGSEPSSCSPSLAKGKGPAEKLLGKAETLLSLAKEKEEEEARAREEGKHQGQNEFPGSFSC